MADTLIAGLEGETISDKEVIRLMRRFARLSTEAAIKKYFDDPTHKNPNDHGTHRQVYWRWTAVMTRINELCDELEKAHA